MPDSDAAELPPLTDGSTRKLGLIPPVATVIRRPEREIATGEKHTFPRKTCFFAREPFSKGGLGAVSSRACTAVFSLVGAASKGCVFQAQNCLQC